MSRLLVVDDEQSICWGLTRLGESMGHEVVAASSAEQALEVIEDFKPHAIVLDVRLPGMDGLTAIEQFRERVGRVPIIVITAYGDLETAVEAVRNGAFEYIIKPFDLDQMQRALERALESKRPADNDSLRHGYVEGMVGRTPEMQEVFKRIALAAASNACVLLCGETGTGKELAARAIHRYSTRSDEPFVAVNVASLSPSLAESELFGHVRGAFTGADESRTGLLVQADGGTLFLDEVADIPLPTQVKLLRALEHGEVMPVGSSETVTTDFRVVSATHQDLSQKVPDGTFRHDLYFRLCTLQIDIPPLRERRDDIEELAKHFLSGLASDAHTSTPDLSPETLAELRQRPWHGNVRELRNTIEHAVIVSRAGTIMPDHLPPPAASSLVPAHGHAGSTEREIMSLITQWAEAQFSNSPEADQLYDQLLRIIEPPLLTVAMERHRDQCAAAARSLGMHRTTLRKKLDQYEIGRDE
ncbi:MAG: sigma-54-dependent Fis family transcriptional regulator [Planctomycetes bacterium]|nr:sigma-54-dependent Fis family transcriptional regulator [Planctomycetota bacterium]MBL7043865.1 sigma-54-dependent Fis family transcriptional regulator [Pirellulaceae bacterium]